MHTSIVPYPSHPNFKDLKGDRFGRLVALYPVGRYRRTYTWLCICDCGVESVVIGTSLSIGNTKSCGCLEIENRITHHMSETPEYNAWKSMIQRCRNPNHPEWNLYGGRFIKVCARWMDSFETFFEDMGPRPGELFSIERRNNSLGYSPENCYWATKRQQANNTRRNRTITHRGETHTVSQWARKLGIHRNTLDMRLVTLGWPIERALTEPVRRAGR